MIYFLFSEIYFMLSISPENLDISNYDYIIGIDEAGRGCLAGPVTVGGFVYKKGDLCTEDVNDSKLVPLKRRLELAGELGQYSHQVLHGSVDEIDEKGIAKVIERLIRSIIDIYKDLNAFYIIDGVFAASFGPHTIKLIKADATYYPVAAASILAKVTRDKLMVELNEAFNHYQFAKHKGYATRLHRSLIQEHGASIHHRKSFDPIRTSLQQTSLL